MFRLSNHFARRGTTLSSLRQRNRANIQVEALEARDLMSVFVPSQIRHAYGFDSFNFLVNGKTITADGKGQTIAIIDAYDDPNIFSNLASFDSTFGIAAPPSFVKAYYTTTNNTGWAVEESLDVEWAHAMAPGANLLLVEAKSSSTSDLFTAVNWARNQPGVSVVSMSWGGSEFSGETSYDQYFTTPHGHQGVTFIASSGDSGSVNSYPAVSPNVLSVGGTSLTTDSSGNYISETGWSGSGGGVSTYEARPSWQSAVQVSNRRTFPDVSYNANPNTGYWVYDTDGASGWSEWGGTSAAAPQWAALVAIGDQGRALGGYNTLDGATQLLPALYGASESTDFHDVTTGSNGGYSAHSGYDLVTGLGTPKARSIVNTILSISNRSFVEFGGAAAPGVNPGGDSQMVTGSISQDAGKLGTSTSQAAFVTVGASEVRLQSSTASQPAGTSASVAAPTVVVVGQAASLTPAQVTSGAKSGENDDLPTQDAGLTGQDGSSIQGVVREFSAGVGSDIKAPLVPAACDACFAQDAETLLGSETGVRSTAYVDEGGTEQTDSVVGLAALAVVTGTFMTGGIDKEEERSRLARQQR